MSMKVNNISMDTVDCNLSLAILKYCEWNHAHGLCYVEVTGIIPVTVSASCREDAEELAEHLVENVDLNTMIVSSIEALRKD